MTAVEPTTAPVEDDLWRYATPQVHSTMHILANEPVVEFEPDTYPGLSVKVPTGAYARFTLSLTGSAEHRAEFARQLREVANAIAAWSK